MKQQLCMQFESAKIRIGSGSSISTGIGTTSILKCVVLWFAQVDLGRMGR